MVCYRKSCALASEQGWLRHCSGEITIESEADYEHNTHLSFNDLAVDNAASPSKADQFRVGCQVILGITGDDLCPILAFLDFIWLDERKILGIVPVARWDPLSKTRFVEAVRQAQAAAHLKLRSMQTIVLGLGWQSLQLWLNLKTRRSKLWGDEKCHNSCVYTRVDHCQLATLSSSLSICNMCPVVSVVSLHDQQNLKADQSAKSCNGTVNW